MDRFCISWNGLRSDTSQVTLGNVCLLLRARIGPPFHRSPGEDVP